MMPVDLSEITHNGRTPSQRYNYTLNTTLSDCGRFFCWFAGITQYNSRMISAKYAKIGIFVNSEIAK
jgi:hypothetical protein